MRNTEEEMLNDKLSLLPKYSEVLHVASQGKSWNQDQNNKNQSMSWCENKGCINDDIWD